MNNSNNLLKWFMAVIVFLVTVCICFLTCAVLAGVVLVVKAQVENNSVYTEPLYENEAPMVYVPSGEFIMGSDSGSPNERPVHTVYLDAYWIDKTEVTNAQFKKCVVAGACKEPVNTSHYAGFVFENHPVVYVDWQAAKDYCLWIGRRLPSEAEWEKAARGTDARIYPWGNNAPDSTLINLNTDLDETRTVGEFPLGASPYGALDMAGNVWEWVDDWYGDMYYQDSPMNNPLGPLSGDYRIIRSGLIVDSWGGGNYDVRTTLRMRYSPVYTNYRVGFRCARGANP